MAKKMDASFDWLRPIETGPKRLISLVDIIATRCFEDPSYTTTLKGTDSATKMVESFRALENRRQIGPISKAAFLKNLSMEGLSDEELKFPELVAKGYLATIEHLNIDINKNSTTEVRAESGLKFGHAWKELFTWVDKNKWTREEVMKLFDKIFEEDHVRTSLAEMNDKGLVNGLEAEVNAFQILKAANPGIEIRYASKEDDGVNKVDIVVIGKEKIYLVQVKGKKGKDVSRISIDDEQGVKTYIANEHMQNRGEKALSHLKDFINYVNRFRANNPKQVEGVILTAPVRPEKAQQRSNDRNKYHNGFDE